MKASALSILSRLSLLLVTLLLCWWMLRTLGIGYHPSSVASALQTIGQGIGKLTPTSITFLILANLVVLIVLTGRWWLFLYGQGYRLPFWRLLGYRVAAFAVSYFTPGPHFGGEPLQVYLITQRHGVPTAVAIAAVMLDKALEMAVNLLVVAAGLGFIVQQQTLTQTFPPYALYMAIGVLLLPLPVLGALVYGRHSLADWFIRQSHWAASSPVYRWLAGWGQTLRHSEAQILTLWQRMRFTFVLASLISLLSWVALIGEFWYMIDALGFALSFAQAMTLLLAMRVALLLPMPAGLGTLEASLALAMLAVGLNPAAGISMSLLIRLRDVTLGLLGLWLGGFALLRQATHQAAATTVSPTEQVSQPDAATA